MEPWSAALMSSLRDKPLAEVMDMLGVLGGADRMIDVVAAGLESGKLVLQGLPRRPRGYYREFVYPVKGLRLPGPARVVLGKKGEVYFTGDHYNTFTRVH